MKEGQEPPTTDRYEPPAVKYVGDVADLTRAEKTVGDADGSTFAGLDIGFIS